jgi:radical SAM superfamily enzyme YgiQ (UPF0313 family)
MSKKFDTIIFSTVVEGIGTLPQTTVGAHRIATEIRDLGLTCQVIHHFHTFSDTELVKVLDKLADTNTILVGFSTVFWSHFHPLVVNAIAKKVKFIVNYFYNKYPNCKIVGGGGSVHILSGFALSKLDAIFEGYPEAIFIEYVNSLKNNSKIPDPSKTIVVGKSKLNVGVYDQSQGIETFNFQNSRIAYEIEDYIRPNDMATIEVARGCIFKCKFCAFPLNGKTNFDYIKNTECLKKELIENYEKYQIQNYIFSDDTFNDSKYKVESIYNMIKSLPFKIRFTCYLRLDLLNAHREHIDMLLEMGLIATFFGVETFHKKSGSLIGKALDPDKAKLLLHDLKHKHWKNDVKIAIGLITGIPHETYESYEDTKKWILSDDNLIEQVRIAALYVPNPMLSKPDPNISLFEKDASKYGFYWTDRTDNWKNINGPVKSYREAGEIANDLKKATKISSREYQGGFNMFQAWRSAPVIDPNIKTFEDLMSMNRFQFTKWMSHTYSNKDNIDKYYTNYKNNFLK